MDSILAIDPGSKQSAYVYCDAITGDIRGKGIVKNDKMCNWLNAHTVSPVLPYTRNFAIEYPAPRGQPMYTQLVDTIYWIGRFDGAYGRESTKIDRKDVKMCLCGNTKSTDSNIRAALLSRFPITGGGKTGQVGTKKEPGPLYGVKKDIWAALAVAITYKELYLEN